MGDQKTANMGDLRNAHSNSRKPINKGRSVRRKVERSKEPDPRIYPDRSDGGLGDVAAEPGGGRASAGAAAPSSSSLSSSGLAVETSTQEKRSREEKKAETTAALTQPATWSMASRGTMAPPLLGPLLSSLLLRLSSPPPQLWVFSAIFRRCWFTGEERPEFAVGNVSCLPK